MQVSDLEASAKIHKSAFIRQEQSFQWLQCHLNAFPYCFCFVTESEKGILGYIIWTQKSGFRKEVVLELEQLAILESEQGKGIGRGLITESLALIKKHLSSHDCSLKNILVSTRHDNSAQKLYQSVLGAEVEAMLTDLYSADEVIMIARNMNFQ
tara:strand:+ start:17278 stop:17739 length:462 start_codon:yes stop_codon:yes gene_type:complete